MRVGTKYARTLRMGAMFAVIAVLQVNYHPGHWATAPTILLGGVAVLVMFVADSFN